MSYDLDGTPRRWVGLLLTAAATVLVLHFAPELVPIILIALILWQEPDDQS